MDVEDEEESGDMIQQMISARRNIQRNRANNARKAIVDSDMESDGDDDSEFGDSVFGADDSSI